MSRRVITIAVVVLIAAVLLNKILIGIGNRLIEAADFSTASHVLIAAYFTGFYDSHDQFQCAVDIAYCKAHMSDYRASASWYGRALEVDPRNLHALYYYAVNLEKTGNCLKALEAIQGALAIRSNQAVLLDIDPGSRITNRQLLETRYHVYLCLDSVDCATEDSIRIVHMTE